MLSFYKFIENLRHHDVYLPNIGDFVIQDLQEDSRNLETFLGGLREEIPIWLISECPMDHLSSIGGYWRRRPESQGIRLHRSAYSANRHLSVTSFLGGRNFFANFFDFFWEGNT